MMRLRAFLPEMALAAALSGALGCSSLHLGLHQAMDAELDIKGSDEGLATIVEGAGDAEDEEGT